MSRHPLTALAEGDLAGWHGIPDGATRQWVTDGLGPGVEDAGLRLVWRGGVATASGVEIMLDGAGRPELVQIVLPTLTADAMEPLGPAEIESPSLWSRGATQFAWPSRGLAVHSHPTDIVRLMGFAPMDAASFAAHPFATVGEPPRRDRPRFGG
jgi:hypothetical protein